MDKQDFEGVLDLTPHGENVNPALILAPIGFKIWGFKIKFPHAPNGRCFHPRFEFLALKQGVNGQIAFEKAYEMSIEGSGERFLELGRGVCPSYNFYPPQCEASENIIQQFLIAEKIRLSGYICKGYANLNFIAQ